MKIDLEPAFSKLQNVNFINIENNDKKLTVFKDVLKEKSVDIGQADNFKLRANGDMKPLSDHVQESENDGTKRYMVIDRVRYESEIVEYVKRKKPKTLIEMLAEMLDEMNNIKHKVNEYELVEIHKSKVEIVTSEVVKMTAPKVMI